MDETKRSNIKIGAAVVVVQKLVQHTGKLTEGIVKKMLTNLTVHHCRIKVMLESGIVGRVKEIRALEQIDLLLSLFVITALNFFCVTAE